MILTRVRGRLTRSVSIDCGLLIPFVIEGTS